MSTRILIGDVRDRLADLPDGSVQCVVTSPPYYQLRSYLPTEHPDKQREIGSEPTLAGYIAALVEVFREVRRVLRDDGVCWLNIGDSYAGSWGNYAPGGIKGTQRFKTDEGERWERKAYGDTTFLPATANAKANGLKPKDLMMVPARLAIALQEPYTVPTCVKDERDRAWLAAMFDGEGTIGIRRHHSNRKAIEQEYQDGYVVYTSLTNNDVPLIDRCVELTGYGRAAVKQKANTTDTRGIVSRFDSYGWRLDGNAAVDVIRAIYPYLIVKRKQAILAYNLDISNKRGKQLRGHGRLPQSEQERRELLYDLIKRANQREEIDVPSWCEEPKPLIEPGWWLRSDVIWFKPNPMPESCRDRPTSAHEHIFLLTKQARYFYDADAVCTQLLPGSEGGWKKPDGWDTGEGAHGTIHRNGREKGQKADKQRGHSRRHDGFNDRWDAMSKEEQQAGGANLRNVWEIATHGFKQAHFATFPPEIPRRCIKAGTSQYGACSACGAPWVRVVERTDIPANHKGSRFDSGKTGVNGNGRVQEGERYISLPTGWQPGCACDADVIPCTVLDPFGGSGTVGLVADQLGRDAILIELNPAYARMAEQRIHGDAPMFARVEVAS